MRARRSYCRSRDHMSRKDIISLCIVLAAVAMAVLVPLLADHPSTPSPADAAQADNALTTSAEPTATTVAEPPSAAATSKAQAERRMRQLREQASRAKAARLATAQA